MASTDPITVAATAFVARSLTILRDRCPAEVDKEFEGFQRWVEDTELTGSITRFGNFKPARHARARGPCLSSLCSRTRGDGTRRTTAFQSQIGSTGAGLLMAGQPRRCRARRLVEMSVILLRETSRAWTAEELLEALGHGSSCWQQMASWERAAARMAAREICAHPHVAVDDVGRLHYWRAESNGHVGREAAPAP